MLNASFDNPEGIFAERRRLFQGSEGFSQVNLFMRGRGNKGIVIPCFSGVDGLRQLPSTSGISVTESSSNARSACTGPDRGRMRPQELLRRRAGSAGWLLPDQ